MIKRVEDNLDRIREVCKRFEVERLETYEETAYDEGDPDWSPVRFLVDAGPADPADVWREIDLALALEEVVGRFVVLTERNRVADQRYLAATAGERITIYESRKQKAAA